MGWYVRAGCCLDIIFLTKSIKDSKVVFLQADKGSAVVMDKVWTTILSFNEVFNSL
jgi:hypothetical protein